MTLEQRTTVRLGAVFVVNLPNDRRYSSPGNGGTLTLVRHRGRRYWYRAKQPGPEVLVVSPVTKAGESISCATLHYFIDVVPEQE